MYGVRKPFKAVAMARKYNPTRDAVLEDLPAKLADKLSRCMRAARLDFVKRLEQFRCFDLIDRAVSKRREDIGLKLSEGVCPVPFRSTPVHFADEIQCDGFERASSFKTLPQFGGFQLV